MIEEQNNGIQRDEPQISDERRALVTKLADEVRKAKERYKPAFKRMRDDMAFTRKQLPNETEDDDRPKVNVVQRHVKTSVSALYAKNPTFVAKRRPRLDFAVWDGKQASLQRAAEELAMAGGNPTKVSPETTLLMSDVQEGITRRRMLDNVGKTLEVVLAYSVAEQQPPFKPQAKQAVRRTVVCGIGYFELGFQRQLEKRPDTAARLADITDRLSTIERLRADIADEKTDPYAAEVEELRLAEAALAAEPDKVVREGLVLDFPSSTSIIPLGPCKQITVGFPGAWGVAKEFCLSTDQIKETYAVDVGASYTGYVKASGAAPSVKAHGTDTLCLVWEIYHRKDGLLYVVCDGYPEFLKEPAPPALGYIEPFFPFFPLAFNQVEDEDEIYPESDVRLIRSTQKEINRKRNAVREHRQAARPLYLARKGMLAEEEDRKNIGGHAAHDVLELAAMESGEDVGKAFAPFPKVGVDPNLYETGTDLSDLQLIVGSQEANLGGTAGDSATESSIAETSRLTGISSNTDDLDDCLSALARAAGQVLLHEMQEETVKKIAGPGAVWPQLAVQEIVEEVFLEIEAGSSGKPNKDKELANLERATPLLVQIPGISPEWLAKFMLSNLDSRIDLEEAFTEGLPSITSMNRMSQAGTGDPATDPNAQGGAGGANQAQDDQSKGGAQPSYQAPDAASQPNVPV